MGLEGAIYTSKEIYFSLSDPSCSSYLALHIWETEQQSRRNRLLFSELENNLKLRQAIQEINPLFVGELLTLESDGKSLSSKYLEPSMQQKVKPAFGATAFCFDKSAKSSKQ